MCKGHAGLARDGEQVQDRIGRAAGGGDARDRVLECRASEDVSGADPLAQQIHHHRAAVVSDLVFLRVHGGDAVEAHGRKADHLHHRGHGVGGVLAAAGAGGGAGNVFEFVQFGIRHFAGGVGADGFEHILNGDVFAAKAAGRDGAAIEHEAGNIQPRQGHGPGGNGFVAAHHADHRVEHLPPANQFDGVGDQLAADQRGAHAFRAHGLAVADGDGVELHGCAAGGADAFLHLGREPPQVEVAGHGFDPGVGHADERLAEIAVGESDCLEHSAGRGAVASVRDAVTAVLEVHGRKIMTEKGSS